MLLDAPAKTFAPDKPFFIYLAPSATHTQHHVPKQWVEKYRDQFDQGWNNQREETIARQKELGVIPADAELSPDNPDIPYRDEMFVQMSGAASITL